MRMTVSTESLVEKWRQNEGVIGFSIRSPIKGRFSEEDVMARSHVWIYGPADSFSLTVKLLCRNYGII
jgi:hypothetical protein